MATPFAAVGKSGQRGGAETQTALQMFSTCPSPINVVAGGFKNDLIAPSDRSSQETEYKRLVEYTQWARVVEVRREILQRKKSHSASTVASRDAERRAVRCQGRYYQATKSVGRVGRSPFEDYQTSCPYPVGSYQSGGRVGSLRGDRVSNLCSRDPAGSRGVCAHRQGIPDCFAKGEFVKHLMVSGVVV